MLGSFSFKQLRRELADRMLDPITAYGMIVGLIVANDWKIFAEIAAKHPSDFPPSYVRVYQEIGDTIARILDEYDFTKSVAFLESVAGRGAAYTEAKARFESEPVKR